MKSIWQPKKMVKTALIWSLALMSGISPVSAQTLHQLDTTDQNSAVVSYSVGDSAVQSVSNWPVKSQDQKAIVVALHGFSLHKSVYRSLAEEFQSSGISTYAMDIRGFGSWSEDAANKARFDPRKTLNDVEEVLVDLRSQNPTTPIFLMGESLGGAMALAEVAQHPHLVDGVIASVPSFERYQSKRTAFAVILKNLIGKGSRVAIGSRLVNQATKDPALKSNWLHDENARLTVSTSELLTFSRFMHENHKNAERISDTSVLILQGGKDRLVKASGTRRLFNELPTRDKEFVLVDKAEHLILEEGQLDNGTYATIGDWIKRNEESKAVQIMASR